MNEMTLFPELEKRYSRESRPALEAQRLAHEISFGPVLFQVSRLMVKFGILQALLDSGTGLTREEVAGKCGLSPYAAAVLLESSLTIGTVLCKEGRFETSKAGWFLLNDPLVRVNMDFNHDVNYLGWFNLEEALVSGKPAGLRVFGDWKTIYEGLSLLPGHVQKSWFGFDHFYSDSAFDEALEIVFEQRPRALLDVGGNTGRWAARCVARDPGVRVTVMDLPRQIELMKEQTAGLPGADRISGHGADLLDRTTPFPAGFDAIWMSQFLDCFSGEEVTSILARAAKAMDDDARLFIMETFWDRQRFEAAAYCLTQISLYFTAMANGNSKMYLSGDMTRHVEEAGLIVERIVDGLGKGHTIMVCKRKNCSGTMDNCSGTMDNCSGTTGNCSGTMSQCSGTMSQCSGTMDQCPGTMSQCSGTTSHCSGTTSQCSGTMSQCSGTMDHCPGTFDEIDVLELLPQRPPFVMIDRLLHCDMTETRASLRVDENTFFREDNRLTEPGLVENIAQTCAARMGYINKYARHDTVKLGFIGAIRDMEISRLPRVGEVLTTRVEVREEIFQVTLVNASIKVGEELIASCGMKIFTTDISSK
jgi:predicted hotdog family 3-hydroxylacyl-ACP dehydratase